MFILLDKPYISDFLKETISIKKIAAFDSGQVINKGELDLIDGKKIVEKFKEDPETKIYTTSENALEWISENLSFTELPKKINMFKDKFLFRELTKDIFPDLFYKNVKYDDIAGLDITDFPKPFIIKPNVGFFSVGVYKVFDEKSWTEVKDDIFKNLDTIKNYYPEVVLKATDFIIEEEIKGVEYAFDAYFDETGNPRVLGIMEHYFSSEADVSDRVYITSKQIIKKNIEKFDQFLENIGKIAELKNFPLHVEVRIDKSGKLIPIEINPVRFGGWCTSPELAHYAFNINSYENFIFNKKPNWDRILETNDEHIYSLIILDNSTGYSGNKIESFDFEKLLSEFNNPLELRKFNHEDYPIFGFLFVKIELNEHHKLDKILKSDLREYVKLKN